METYAPFIHHLKAIACHYKQTGSIPSSPTATNSFSDPECGGTEPKKKNAVSTIDKTHQKKAFQPVKCCGSVFRYPSHYEQHMKALKHVQSKEVKRTQFQLVECCGTTFKLNCHLERHMKTAFHKAHCKPITLTCNICNTSLPHDKALQQHLRKNHGRVRTFRCTAVDKCPFVGMTLKSLRRHVTLKHDIDKSPKVDVGSGPFECCGKVFQYPCLLTRHQKSLNHLGKIRCCEKGCNMVLESSEEFRKHKVSEHFDGKYECLLCHRIFLSNGELRAHIKRSHAKYTTFECNVCPSKFTNLWYLKRHIIIHNKDKCEEFSCDLCGFKFKRRDHLKAHQKIHSKNYFYCTICKRSFQSDKLLKIHVVVHQPCQICGLKFRTLKKRESHLKSHLQPTKQEGKKILPAPRRKRNQVYKQGKENSSRCKKNSGVNIVAETIEDENEVSPSSFVINENQSCDTRECFKEMHTYFNL